MKIKANWDKTHFGLSFWESQKREEEEMRREEVEEEEEKKRRKNKRYGFMTLSMELVWKLFLYG